MAYKLMKAEDAVTKVVSNGAKLIESHKSKSVIEKVNGPNSSYFSGAGVQCIMEDNGT